MSSDYFCVNYTIPGGRPTKLQNQSIFQSLMESRSHEYDPIWNKLDKLGFSPMTSFYLVEFDGTAQGLVDHLLNGLSPDVASRVELFINPLAQGYALYPSQNS